MDKYKLNLLIILVLLIGGLADSIEAAGQPPTRFWYRIRFVQEI